MIDLNTPCKTCGAIDRYESDGKCKICARNRAKKYRATNNEKVKLAEKEKYKKHREKILQSQKLYSAKNKEKIAKKNAEYYKNNKARIKNRMSEYYEKTSEIAKQRMLKWHQENKGLNRIYCQNRRAKIKEVGGVLSKDIVKKLFKLQNGKCSCCNKKLDDDFHVDHIIPIALGGSNTDENVQLLHKKCNLRKRSLHPIDFMQSMGFLL